MTAGRWMADRWRVEGLLRPEYRLDSAYSARILDRVRTEVIRLLTANSILSFGICLALFYSARNTYICMYFGVLAGGLLYDGF